MKTQRRHELQTNQLADTLGRYLNTIRPYQRQLSFGLVAVVAIVVAVLWLNNKRQAQASAGWSDYFAALGDQKAESLEDIPRLHGDSTAALWAQQSAGDLKLATGAAMLYVDRKDADKNLRDAEKAFLAVEQDAARYPLLLQRARFGLAQVYESLCKVEKAREYYQRAIDTSADSALAGVAKQRLDTLSDKSVDGWYAWFERQEPVPPSGGSATAAPKVPADLGVLPDRPDLSFPGSDISKAISEAAKSAAAEATTELTPKDAPQEPVSDAAAQPAPSASQPPPTPPGSAPANATPTPPETPADKPAPAAKDDAPTSQKPAETPPAAPDAKEAKPAETPPAAPDAKEAKPAETPPPTPDAKEAKPADAKPEPAAPSAEVPAPPKPAEPSS